MIMKKSRRRRDKKKPPKLSGRLSATAATGRWNALIIHVICFDCQPPENTVFTI